MKMEIETTILSSLSQYVFFLDLLWYNVLLTELLLTFFDKVKSHALVSCALCIMHYARANVFGNQCHLRNALFAVSHD